MKKSVIWIVFLVWTITSLSAYTFDWRKELLSEKEGVVRLKENPFITISLGANCGVAEAMARNGVRMASFPFDWIVTPFESLYSLIKNDFLDFLNPINFDLLQKHIFYDKKYRLKFYHDFAPKLWQCSFKNGFVFDSVERKIGYQSTYNKYCRRVARFHLVLNSGIPVYLIRTQMTKQEAFLLYDLLSSKFPDGDLTLISLQIKKDGADEDWGHKNILHFSIGRDGKLHSSAKGNTPDWKRVFRLLDKDSKRGN